MIESGHGGALGVQLQHVHVLIETYAAWLVAAGASARTVAERTSAVRRLCGHAEKDDPRRLTAADVILWLGRVASPASRATYYQHAAAFARFLEALGERPTFMQGVPSPRVRRGTPRPIAADELAAALSVASPRARTMLLLAGWAGLRVHEIQHVRGEDVTEQAIYVRGKGGVAAYVPTHPLLWTAGQAYPRSGWWWPSRLHEGQPITRWQVWHLMKQPLLAVGSRATPHQIRHFYGSELLRKGANLRTVQELLRHANVSSTQVYTMVSDEDRQRAIATLPEIA